MRVFVSDCRLYRAALSAVLDAQTDVELVGVTSDLHDAAACLGYWATDIVLIDERPTGEHLRSLRAATRRTGGVRFVVLGRRDREEAQAWLEAGATKIVDQRASAGELRRALQFALRA